MRLEHHVELASGAELAATVGAFAALRDLVGAEAVLALLALNERIGKTCDVAARLPGSRIHEYGCVHSEHIVAVVDEALPPDALDVVLQRHAERAVVPRSCESPVDLGSLE